MRKEIVKPRLIAFEVTRRCRYSCRHCRAGAGADFDEDLSTSQCKKILRSVARYNKCVIILTGGEPMEREDIYELISFGTKLGLRMVMATCGYLIDEDSMTKIKEAGILALSFSLDGASAEMHDKFRESKGAFDAAVNAARLAKKAGVKFQINTTISKLNIDEAVGIGELALQLGAYCYNPFILVPAGRGKELIDCVLEPVEYEALLNELLDMKLNSKIQLRVTCGPQFARIAAQSSAEKRLDDVRGCLGGTEFGFISYKGDVQICGFLNISAGNLVENNFNFGKIWRNSEFLKRIRNRAGYTGKCRLCDFVGICGGCRARAFAVSGDCLASDPVCDYKVDVKK
jgi:radical SAM protein with 4Fe4S-binding SPASM domain